MAEVLITLAVIGVVAALTIPTLVQKHQEKVTVTKVKKFVTMMSQAIQLAEIDNGEIASWGFEPVTEPVKDQEDGTSSDKAKQEYYEKVSKFINIVKPYLKGVTLIDRTNNPNILDRYSLDGTKFRSWNHQLLFPDGTFLSVTNYSSNCSEKRGSSKPLQNICGELFYDVNGIKGPNATGKDVFLFYYTRYGVVPMGTELDNVFSFKDHCSLNKKYDFNGYGCAAWVMYNENMDYLHCNNLSWDGKHKCD